MLLLGRFVSRDTQTTIRCRTQCSPGDVPTLGVASEAQHRYSPLLLSPDSPCMFDTILTPIQNAFTRPFPRINMAATCVSVCAHDIHLRHSYRVRLATTSGPVGGGNPFGRPTLRAQGRFQATHLTTLPAACFWEPGGSVRKAAGENTEGGLRRTICHHSGTEGVQRAGRAPRQLGGRAALGLGVGVPASGVSTAKTTGAPQTTTEIRGTDVCVQGSNRTARNQSLNHVGTDSADGTTQEMPQEPHR